MESEKPFPCSVPECYKSFATEDHLAVHKKSHEILLNLNLTGGKNCFIVDKTPTPSRLIKNLEEVGLFEENIFDETFRKAIEDKPPQSPPNFHNEDTLHTPQIPLYVKEQSSLFGYRENKEKAATTNQETSEIIQEVPVKKSPSRGVTKRKPRVKKLKEILPTTTITVDQDVIPINFPDQIQIQPKWTVMFRYPTLEPDVQQHGQAAVTSSGSVKESLQALLVKNESIRSQTIKLTPPEISATGDSSGDVGPQFPVLNLIPQEEEEAVPVVKTPVRPREITNKEVVSARSKRYRDRKRGYLKQLVDRNEFLEEENRKLKMENMELREKLEQALKRE